MCKKMKGVGSRVNHSTIRTRQQTGGAADTGSEQNESETESVTSNSSCTTSDLSDDDDENDVDTQSDADRDDDNWVFNRILSEAERELNNNGRDSHKRLCRLFRQKFIDYLVWFHNLRKNSIYKKVMTIAKDLEDGNGDYSRIEALNVAVNQRRFLLNELVPEFDSDAGDGGDDQETEDTE